MSDRNIQKSVFVKEIKKQYWLYLMILPVIAGFLIFYYLPMYGVLMAFQDYDLSKGIIGSPWVGFKHFLNYIHNFNFLRQVKNTLLLGLYGFIWGFPAPILLALLLNEVYNRKFKRIVQSITYLPYFISTVIIIGILYNLFSSEGVINSLLMAIGGERVDFLTDPKYFRTLFIGSGIWQSVGYGTIVYLAALTGINQELYEAAIIDGAKRLQLARYITLPGITPTIRVLIILGMAGITTIGFEKVYLMANPAVMEVAEVISYYVYRQGIEKGQFSFAAAAGFIDSVVGLVLLVTANFLSKKTSGEGVW